jgi:hypothetical protein
MFETGVRYQMVTPRSRGAAWAAPILGRPGDVVIGIAPPQGLYILALTGIRWLARSPLEAWPFSPGGCVWSWEQYVHRVRSVLAGLLVAIAIACVMPLPVAQAQMRLCAKHQLFGSDIQTVRQRSIKAAAGHEIDWKTLSACTNPRSAYAWVETARDSTRDGTVLHANVNYTRRCD